MKKQTSKLGPLVLAIVILSVAPGVVAQDIFREDVNLYSTRELTGRITARSGEKIIIRSASTLRGDISVTASSGGEVALRYTKKAKTGSKSNAIDFIDLIAVNLERSSDGIRLELRAPNPAPWEGMETGLVSASLSVPENCEIEVDAQYFDFHGEGPFKSVVIPNSLGRIDIENVSDLCEVATSNRRISLRQISGELNASTTNSSLTAERISCPRGKAVFRNDGGDILIETLTGELNIRNKYARIEIQDYTPKGDNNYIRGFNGPILVAITHIDDAQLLVTNRYEDIELTVPEDISAVLSLAVEEGGRIELSNVQVVPDLVEYNRLNLVAGNGRSVINGSVRGKGNIYLHGERTGE